MKLSFRTTRNIGLGALLFIVIITCLSSYWLMSKTSARLTNVITTRQTLMSEWMDLLQLIESCEDYMYDYHRGKKEYLSPVMLQINNIVERVEKLRQITKDKEEIACIDILDNELVRYRQAVYIFSQETGRRYDSEKEIESIALEASSSMVEASYNAMRVVSLRFKVDSWCSI